MEEKLELDNLVIEVTRRCNMNCDHCLRGEAENLDFDINYFRVLLSKVQRINSITFSGGEPSLVPYIIRELLSSAMELNVEIDNFYMATNGKEIESDLISVLVEWYSYCDDNEITQVELSNDHYHQEVNGNNVKMLKALSFFSSKHNSTESKSYNNRRYLIAEGKAESWGGRELPAPEIYGVEDNYIYETLYLNCIGDVIAGCDISYNRQKDPKYIICNVHDFSKEEVKKHNERNERG